MQLDDLLPDYDFNEVHQTIVEAQPRQADGVMRSLDMNEVPVVSFLMSLRELPARLAGRETITMKQDQLSGKDRNIIGNCFFDHPGEEIVFGFIGKPWNPVNVEILENICTAEDFMAFSQPGYVRVAANYSYEAVKGGTLVRTESRIAGTSRAATRRFLPYWMVIRLPSGLIRRCMLAALKKKLREGVGNDNFKSIEGGLQ